MWTLPKFDWPQQKQQCLSCAHCHTTLDMQKHGSSATILCCAISPYRARRGMGSCIDNRTRGPCGPNAKNWKGLDMTD